MDDNKSTLAKMFSIGVLLWCLTLLAVSKANMWGTSTRYNIFITGCALLSLILCCMECRVYYKFMKPYWEEKKAKKKQKEEETKEEE